MTKLDHRGVSAGAETGNIVHNGELLASTASIDGTVWKLELLRHQDFKTLREQINNLAAGANSPNPFFEPAFLEPAARFLGQGQVRYLCVYGVQGQRQELLFFAPVIEQKSGLRRRRILQVWSHPYAPLGTPITSQSNFGHMIDGLANCIEAMNHPSCAALHFVHLPTGSDFAKALHANSSISANLREHSKFTRAAILDRDGLANATARVSGKRKQRMRKAHERLSDHGKVHFSCADNLPQMEAALIAHLQLEAKGWKGERGTSILTDDDATHFANSAVGSLIDSGNCAIHALNLNDQPVSSMIMIRSGSHYFPWKIAFDEDYAKFSVGNLLTVHVNNLLAEQGAFSGLDSLASELNQTAQRFWPDQLELSNLVIGLGPQGATIADQIANELELINKTKRKLKTWLGRSL